MRLRACSVVGCEDKSSARHRFPNPAVNMQRLQKWIEACGNEKLYSVDPKKLYDNYRVCHIHFTSADISSNNFLIKTSVPNKFLPNRQIIRESTSSNLLEESSIMDTDPSCTQNEEILIEAVSNECEGDPSQNAGPSSIIVDEEMLLDQIMQYVRNLEQRVQRLEDDKRTLTHKINQLATPTGAPTVAIPQDSGIGVLSDRPEAVVRALQVLEVREQLEREGRMERGENMSDTPSADMDDGKKALVRKTYNVVWRKLEEGPQSR